jgi:hypothetical protein
MRRLRVAALAATIVVSISVAAGAEAAAARAVPARFGASGPSRLLGIVPPRTAVHRTTGGNLVYHGGPVMRTNKTFAIYWIPSGWSMVSGYRSTINRYFVDVARDSGGTRNVYSTLTQYSDTTGRIAYSQTFGGSTTTTTAFPANGCPAYGITRVCLTDDQVAAQVKRVIAAKGWVAGPTHAFFLFLPKGVGTCDDAGGSECAFVAFCAYHSWAGSGATQVVYANVPYADTDPSGCSTGQRPNGNDADDTLNVASHEHREVIQDPNANAWFDSSGEEGADKCAWTFGAAIGSTATGAYNQVIDGHVYYIQEEWTNAHSRCVQRGI